MRTNILRHQILRRLTVAAALTLVASTAFAHGYLGQGLKIIHPWSRPAAKGSAGAGFGDFTNTGKEPVSLVSITTAGAASASVHQTVQTNGVFSMKAVPTLVIAPGQTVKFEPGGYHVMFAGLKSALAPGSKIPATLTFKRGASTFPVELSFEVDPPKEEHKH